MTCLRRTGLALILVAFCSLAVRGQAKPAPAPDILLTVGGEVEHPLKLNAADLAKLPHRTVRAKEHNGAESSFDGVELNEILKLAGVKFGEELRGKALSLYVVAEATDHYRVVFALAELDPGFFDRVIIVADRQDGKPLDAAHGPLRLIAPDEKRPARWVRQVISLTVRRGD